MSIGKFGEQVALLFLKKKGYRLLCTNYVLSKIGEIDIVMRDTKGALVFVEVKTLGSDNGIYTPEQHFDEEKRFRLRRLAQAFCNKHPEYVHKRFDFRIDLVAVTVKDVDADFENFSSTCTVNHYENAC